MIGGLSAHKKQQIKDKWIESSDLFIFINIDAGGTGLDGLQEVCSNSLFIEIPNDSIKLDQAIARIDRSGQKLSGS